jgi:hypothetical protein
LRGVFRAILHVWRKYMQIKRLAAEGSECCGHRKEGPAGDVKL